MVGRIPDSKSLPDDIIEFEVYIQDVKDVTKIANNESIQLKNGNIGKQKAGK